MSHSKTFANILRTNGTHGGSLQMMIRYHPCSENLHERRPGRCRKRSTGLPENKDDGLGDDESNRIRQVTD